MVEKKEGDFYKSQWTKLWNYSDRRVLFCKECIDKFLKEYTERYGERTALIIMLHILDMPFVGVTYKGIIEKNNFFNVGLYIRMLNGGQYQYKDFSTTLVNGELDKTEGEVREEVEARWSASDKRNRTTVLSVLGYDAFENCGMTENDRRYCFNTLAGYLDIEGLRDDGHKIQCVVRMTQSQLQAQKLDEAINKELMGLDPDEKKISSLTGAKKATLDVISRLAEDNSISSKHNKTSSPGQSVLTKKMKEMELVGFEKIKVNLFDIETSEAIKQIADASNRSIMEQLTWDANDYTEMIKEQREMLSKLYSEVAELKETNRLLKIRNLETDTKKKK